MEFGRALCRVDRRDRRQRDDRAGLGRQRELPQPAEVEPLPIRKPHADVDQPVIAPERRGLLSKKTAGQLAGDLCDREAGLGGPRGIDVQTELGIPSLRHHDVHQPGDLLKGLGRARQPTIPASGRSSPKILTSTGSGLPARSPSMSCSSMTNSIVMPGISFAKIARCASTTSSAARARSERGLSRTTISPVFCGWRIPQLRPRTPREAGHLRRFLQHGLEPLHHAVGLWQRRAFRGPVVDM